MMKRKMEGSVFRRSY